MIKTSIRRVRAVTMILLSGLLPHAASAQSTPPPSGVYHSLDAGKVPRDAGTVHGEIIAVDYDSDEIDVKTAKGVQHIAVLPSTTIYRGKEYVTLADLRRGAQVDVSVSDVGGRLVAQSIRLK